MPRFYAENDGKFTYIIDTKSDPNCNKRGYCGQRGRRRTDLDIACCSHGEWLTSTEIRQLARKLVKTWNTSPPW